MVTEPLPSGTSALVMVRESPSASLSLARTSMVTVFDSVTDAVSAVATGPSLVTVTEMATMSLADSEPSEAVTFTQNEPASSPSGVPEN